MPETKTSFLHRLDDEDTLSVPIDPPKPVRALDLLVETCVETAFGRRALARFERDSGLAVVVEVACATWVPAVADMIEHRMPRSRVVQVTGSPKRASTTEFSETRAIEALTAGQTVVAVSPAPRETLPTSFLASADLTVTVAGPSLEAVRRAIASVCSGSSRSLRDRDLRGLGLFDIAAAIRPGAAKASIERLRSASARQAVAKLQYPDTPMVGDLAGYGEAKVWAEAVVADFDRIRAGEAVVLPSAVLFGPPGTGKTRLAQALAKTANVRLVTTSVSEWFSASRGDLDGVVKLMQARFGAAVEAAPSVIFIDEIDALPDRATMTPRGAEWWTAVVSWVLLQIDRLRSSAQPVLLMAATNHLDHIDDALLRAGRFDRKIEIGIPEGSELEAIFRSYLGDDLADSDIAGVVRQVRRATGASVVEWVERARRRARDAARPLTRDDLLEVVMPPDGRSAALVEAIAVHESGHAVVAFALGSTVKEVNIIAGSNAGGETAIGTEGMTTRAALEDRLTVILAGRAADEIVGRGPSAGAVDDLATATRTAAAMRASFGLHDELLHLDPDAVQVRLAADPDFARLVEADLRAALTRARVIVTEHKDLVQDVAAELMTRRVLDGADIARLVRSREKKQTSTDRKNDPVRQGSPRPKARGRPAGPP